jgi:glycosyltransferase involved in cell wall biosynthesis
LVRADPAALAAALVDLLSDPNLRAEAGGRAARHAVSAFSWTRAADAHERLYAELISGG